MSKRHQGFMPEKIAKPNQKFFSFRMSPEMDASITKVAKTHKLSKSRLVKSAIQYALDNMKKEG